MNIFLRRLWQKFSIFSGLFRMCLLLKNRCKFMEIRIFKVAVHICTFRQKRVNGPRVDYYRKWLLNITSKFAYFNLCKFWSHIKSFYHFDIRFFIGYYRGLCKTGAPMGAHPNFVKRVRLIFSKRLTIQTSHKKETTLNFWSSFRCWSPFGFI